MEPSASPPAQATQATGHPHGSRARPSVTGGRFSPPCSCLCEQHKSLCALPSPLAVLCLWIAPAAVLRGGAAGGQGASAPAKPQLQEDPNSSDVEEMGGREEEEMEVEEMGAWEEEEEIQTWGIPGASSTWSQEGWQNPPAVLPFQNR